MSCMRRGSARRYVRKGRPSGGIHRIGSLRISRQTCARDLRTVPAAGPPTFLTRERVPAIIAAFNLQAG